MTDLLTQLRAYGEQIESDESLRYESLFVPAMVRHRPRRATPIWVYALVGVLATLLVVGISAWLIRNAEGPTRSTPVDQPVELIQPTVDDIEFIEIPVHSELLPSQAESFYWPPGVISNGTRFLAPNSVHYLNTAYASSVDGVSWSLGPEEMRPLYGGRGEFLGITTVPGVDLSETSDTRLRRSSDGLRWSEAQPVDEAPWRLATYRYFGLAIDEILSLSLDLPDAWSEGGPAGAIIKLADTYIAYYFTAGYWTGGLDTHGEESFLGAAVSSNGRDWRPTDALDFLHEWFHGDRSWWDGGASDLAWSWTFAISEDRVLALTGDADRHTLWESADGLRWEEVPVSYLEPPSVDVFASGLSGQEHGGIAYRVAALETGWAIIPLGYLRQDLGETIQPLGEEGRGLFFSVDGENWLPIQSLRVVRATAAGDSVFIKRFGLQGSLIARYEPTAQRP